MKQFKIYLGEAKFIAKTYHKVLKNPCTSKNKNER